MAISIVRRLPDPGYISGAPGANSVSLNSDAPIGFSYTNAGVGKARALSAHRWKFSLRYPPMTQHEFDIFYPFVINLQGRLRAFEVCLPNYYMPKDGWIPEEDVLSVASTTAAGSSSVTINNWKNYVADKTGPELKIGDVIQFPEASTKVYLVSGVEAVGSARTVSIIPNLVAECAADSSVRVNNVLFRVRLASDTLDYSLALNRLYTTSLNVEESIEYA